MRRSVLAAIAALVVFVAPARAVPGDPLPQPLSPIDATAVATDPDGILFAFTCPAYRNSPASEEPTSDLVGYGLSVFRGGTVVTGSSDVVRDPADPSRCTALVKSTAYENQLQTTPGAYTWSVSRTCYCGNGQDTEVGPAAAFRIVAPKAKLSAAAPKRAYAGYSFRATLATDLADGQKVQLQRQAGSRWADAGKPVEVNDGKASALVTLAGKGSTKLRWSVTRGPQTQVSAPATVTVRKATSWTTRRSAGAYQGPEGVSFRVARNGRSLRGFQAPVATYCIGSPTDVTKNYLKTSFALIKRVKVAPDGRFLVSATVSKTTAVISGRLRGGKVTGGRVELSYPLCSGARTFTARKR